MDCSSCINNILTFKIVVVRCNNKVKISRFNFIKNDNQFNIFLPNYNSFELDYKISNNEININLSKQGIINLQTAAVDQSIEIVRRRIDDVGTKEPTILQRGEKRILVELPGLKDPERIKSL